MNLDELLERQSSPTAEADRLATELARAISSRRRRTRQRGWIAGGVIGGIVLASVGGLTAAAQTGMWPFTHHWVDSPNLVGEHIVTVDDGTEYRCAFELRVDADFVASGTRAQIQDAKKVARLYVHTIDLDAIRPDFSSIGPLDSPYAKQAYPLGASDPAYWMNAWSAGVVRKVTVHMIDIHMPVPSITTGVGACTAEPKK